MDAKLVNVVGMICRNVQSLCQVIVVEEYMLHKVSQEVDDQDFYFYSSCFGYLK